MKIVGNSKQDGIPSPDNPVQITNETNLIITDKEGNKKEMPFKYEKILKEDNKIEKINGEWCLVRRKPMNEEEIINILTDDIVALNVGYEKYEEAVQGLLDLYNKEKERNKDLEEIEKEHKEENGRLREEIEKYKSLLAKSTADRVVTSIKDNKKSKEDLEMLNEGWKIKVKEKMELLREDIQYSANPLSIDNSKYAIEVLEELLEESEK